LSNKIFVIKFFIADVPLPEVYVTAFTLASPSGGKVSVSALNKILSISGLPHTTIEKVRHTYVYISLIKEKSFFHIKN